MMRPVVWRTDPTYWVSVMAFVILSLALGLDFIILNPTFSVLATPNQVLGSIFVALAVDLFLALNLGYVKWFRLTMFGMLGYFVLIGFGTTKPFLDGTGSLQLPIMYVAVCAVLVRLVMRPYAEPTNPVATPVVMFVLLNLALGLNFLILSPTFLIYGANNRVWAGIFLAFAVALFVALNSGRLNWVRFVLASMLLYFTFIGAGTMQPFIDGTGSLHLPIMYIAVSTLLVRVILQVSIGLT